MWEPNTSSTISRSQRCEARLMLLVWFERASQLADPSDLGLTTHLGLGQSHSYMVA
ncbi:hypothetical protein BDV39DRAFT_187289 [Aspergillus sergii]|uniref:Uncharacterized protein n=1 Tax=Aspergillus sergii TaxID=1034303 RepID=A0A5N6WIM9_9EURO|nr:hypothetical protein BDV39DRAFT_187289 [Aspergillus sergii]